MPDKTWKAAERRVAALFGTTRTTLSGGNGRQTRSDSLHERLFIETKYRTRFALVDLFIDTAAKATSEQKFPVLALVEKRRRLVFALVPLKRKYLYRLMEELVKEDGPADPVPASSDSA